MGQFLKMASSMLTKKLFSYVNQFVRFSHTNSNNSNFIKNGHFSAKRNSLTSKRNLQSIARFRGAKERRDGSVFDPIAVGARNISTDPCLSNVTLGELRDAKFQSQKLQEKILRWIWEGESWSVFAENDIQITKGELEPDLKDNSLQNKVVKLLPNFSTLRIHWSATGVQYTDKIVQQILDETVSLEIQERMESQEDYRNMKELQIEFVPDMSHIHAAEIAAGQHYQHPMRRGSIGDKSSTELNKMKILTGIPSLKTLNVTVDGGSLTFEPIEEKYTERSEIHGLDYHSVLEKNLAKSILKVLTAVINPPPAHLLELGTKFLAGHRS